MISLPLTALRITSTLLQITTIFQKGILRENKRCSDVLYVFDVNKPSSFISSQAENSQFSTYMVIPAQPSNMTTSVPSFPTRFSSPCAMIPLDLSELFQAEDIVETSMWMPLRILGSPTREYHIILIETCNQDVLSSQLRPAARKLFHSFFVKLCHDTLTLFRIGGNGENLVDFGKFSMKVEEELPKMRRVLKLWPNFWGETFNIVTCGTCPQQAAAEYKRTGVWTVTLIGVIYEFSMLINGTVEPEQVVSFPRDEPDEDGEWDSWYAPVVDGSAAVTLVNRVSLLKARVTYITFPFAFDDVCFITAKPKRIPGSQGFSKLFTPFGFYIWAASSVSLVLLFVVMEIAINVGKRPGDFNVKEPHRFSAVSLSTQRKDWHGFSRTLPAATRSTAPRQSPMVPLTAILRRRSRLAFMTPRPSIKYKQAKPFYTRRLTLAALLKPVVGQGPLSSDTFAKTFGSGSAPRFLLSLWMLVVFVLSCEYTSVMTSQIVLPTFTRPPTTFKELSSSDYAISAVAWTDNFGLDFEALNKSFMSRIINEVTDYNPLDSDCYVSIFDGKTSCIGTSKFIAFLGTEYIVDQNGEPLFVRSAETYFSTKTFYAVSHYYPVLFEPLEFVVKTFQEYGLINLWDSNHAASTVRKGKLTKRRELLEAGQAQGRDFSTNENSLNGFLIHVLFLGNGLATLAFLREITNICFHWLFNLFRSNM